MSKLLVVLVVALAAAGCSVKEPPYAETIGAWRADKDAFMRSSESPVPAERRTAFPPLPYFPIKEDYRVPAELDVRPDDTVLLMPTSTGQRRQMRRIGTLRFTLKGQPMTLTAFVEAPANDMTRLFVPFADLTSGTESYQGGRYLDLVRTPTGLYDLDFNRAYHPFCLFNPSYDCPIPPRENRLEIPIMAGERLPQS